MRAIDLITGFVTGAVFVVVAQAAFAHADAPGDTSAKLNITSLEKVQAQGPTHQGPVIRGDGTYTARTTMGDWGILYADARDSQRIEGFISLGNLTRITVESGKIANARSARSKGGPVVEFDVDENSGDCYILVEEGKPGQIINAFITTDSDETFHFMLTIKEAPALQIIVRAKAYRDELNRRSQERRQAVTEDAVGAYASFVRVSVEERLSAVEKPVYGDMIQGFKAMNLGFDNSEQFWSQAYLLTNDTKAPMRFEEAVVQRPGVRAVVADQRILQPKQSMVVLMIYEGVSRVRG